MSFGSIMELSKYLLALWSMTMWSFLEECLGIVCIGGLYMLGSRLGPNGVDILPAFCSERTWCAKKICSSSVLVGRCELSCVIGYSSGLSGHGQKLSCRPVMTDWQNRGLGWLSKSLSNMLMWIKHVILKPQDFQRWFLVRFRWKKKVVVLVRVLPQENTLWLVLLVPHQHPR